MLLDMSLIESVQLTLKSINDIFLSKTLYNSPTSIFKI
jgi:hypothetical protein